MITKNNIITFIIGLVIGLLFCMVTECNNKPSTTTKTTIETKPISQPIKDVVIGEPTVVDYKPSNKTSEQSDTRTPEPRITPSEAVIEEPITSEENDVVNKYPVTLKSNDATANLQVFTTGTLLDVEGVITYPEKTITKETTITKDASGLFLYAQTSMVPMLEQFQVGVDYVIKNKYIIGTSASYNTISTNGYVNLKVGFKL